MLLRFARTVFISLLANFCGCLSNAQELAAANIAILQPALYPGISAVDYLSLLVCFQNLVIIPCSMFKSSDCLIRSIMHLPGQLTISVPARVSRDRLQSIRCHSFLTFSLSHSDPCAFSCDDGYTEVTVGSDIQCICASDQCTSPPPPSPPSPPSLPYTAATTDSCANLVNFPLFVFVFSACVLLVGHAIS